jgi:hypothetical protein
VKHAQAIRQKHVQSHHLRRIRRENWSSIGINSAIRARCTTCECCSVEYRNFRQNDVEVASKGIFNLILSNIQARVDLFFYQGQYLIYWILQSNAGLLSTFRNTEHTWHHMDIICLIWSKKLINYIMIEKKKKKKRW